MRNLHLYKVIETSSNEVKEQTKEASHFSADTRTGHIFFITQQKLIGVQNGQITSDYEFDSSMEHDSPVVCFDYLSDTDELFWIYQNGHCFRINVEEWKAVEDTGVMFEPVWGAAWSPGYQNLVVVTENTVLLLSRELDMVSEAEVRPNYAGKEELQTIGWGSKETQFQGSAGKSAREVADRDRQLTQILPYDQEEFKTLVRWRADAQIIAISSVEKVENGNLARRIRIWDGELNFLALCDPLSGVEPTLEVLPSRNLFVTSRTNIDNQVRSLWFYEQNGQYRRHFEVPNSNKMNLKTIQTNCDGTILALVFEEEINRSEIQFWTMSNAQWTQKLAYRFENSIVCTNFSQEFASNFQFMTSEGVTVSFDMGFVYNSENGRVVSVGGDILRLTDLNKAPIPPPMSHYQHQLEAPVSSVSLDEHGKISILDADWNLKLFEWKDKEVITAGEVKISDHNFVYNVKVVDPKKISFVSLNSGEYKVEIVDLDTKQARALATFSEPILYQHVDGEGVYVITEKGRCFVQKAEEQSPKILFETNLADFFNWTYIGNGKLLGLSPNFNLYINDQSLVQNCSSFSLNGNLCLFTTFEHKLHVLDVYSEKKKPDEGRKVERGAAVVGHEGSNGTKCWLQMPRGNLEGIHPRFLTLTTLKNLLDDKTYLEAAIQMRKHRINMNLLIDHDQQAFFENSKQFLDQFSPDIELHMDILQLVILGLEEENCTNTVFREHYEERPKCPGKVEKVATELEKVIRKKLDSTEKSDMLYLTLLSCLVRKTTKNSATAALLDLKERSSTVSSAEERTRLLSSSLRHLSYIVDPNQLFEAALRTFDLNILSMIADKLQKDPKEYIPLINRLKGLEPENYRRFHVCLLLEDWSQALDYISKVPERFEECCEHIKQYGLYSRAIRLFKGSEKYKEICALSADFYYKKAKFADAAFLYRKSEQFEKALQAFESAQNVEDYCSLYEEIGTVIPKTRFELGLKKMAVQLEQKGRTEEAAQALIRLEKEKSTAEKFENSEKILQLLAAAGKWRKIVELGRRIPESIKLSIFTLKVEQLITLFSNQKNQIQEYQERLLELRELKQKHLNAWIEAQGDDGFDCAQSETTSIASSMMSQASRMSSASSRRRKNVDKKKSVIKKGSQYEDAAILLALKSLYQNVDSNQEEVSELLRALVDVDLLDEASNLQETFEILINLCNSKKNSIWPEYLKAKDLPGPIFETFRCEDGIVRLPEANSMPPRFQLTEELMPPKIRTNISWKLEMLQ